MLELMDLLEKDSECDRMVMVYGDHRDAWKVIERKSGLANSLSEEDFMPYLQEDAEVCEVCTEGMCVITFVAGDKQKALFVCESKGSQKEDTGYREMLGVLFHLVEETWKKVDADRQLNLRAYYDLVTGLPNRSFFDKILQEEMLYLEEHPILLRAWKGIYFM